MHDSYQAYRNGVSMQHYVDARFHDQSEQLERIGDTLERIERRVVTLEARWWRLIGGGSALLFIANYASGKYL